MFVAQMLVHRQRVTWDAITHIRLLPGAQADTNAGQKILDYIKQFVDKDGIAEIARFQDKFPAVRTHPTKVRAMQADLRHMANDRNAGTMQENKGLLEIGSLVNE